MGMVVGMNPGEKEDASGVPFTGPSGKKLDSLLALVGLDRSKLYVTNAVKCRTPGNNEPTPQEMDACRPYLIEEVQNVKPKAILALGNTALRSLTGKSGIASYRNIELALRNQFMVSVAEQGSAPPVFVTYHPAYLLKADDRNLAEVLVDLRRFKAFLEGEEEEKFETKIFTEEGPYSWGSSPFLAYDIETEYAPEINKSPQKHFLAESDIKMVQVFDGKTAHIFQGAAIPDAIASLSGQPLVGFNSAKFDDRITGLESEDAMLPPYLLNEEGKHNLETMAIQYLGVRPWKHLSKTGDGKDLIEYGAKDVVYTYRLWEKTYNALDERQRRLYKHILLPVSRAFTTIEQNGVYVNRENLDNAKSYYQEVNRNCRERLKDLAAELGLNSFNPSSNGQLASLLFDKLGLPCYNWTPTGKPCTDEKSIKSLREQHSHWTLEAIIEMRHAAKMDSTYLSGWEKYIGQDGRMHPSYFVVTKPHDRRGSGGGAVTGRSSASDPAIQTIPREVRIRSIIGAPPGRVLISADYSQIELRIAAWIANEKNMLEVYRNPNADVHMEMAKAILAQKGIIDREPTTEERARAKPPNFMFVYGGQAAKYQEIALKDYDMVVSYPEALATYRAFHTRWPDFGPWYKEILNELKSTGQVVTPFGRVRHLPDINSTDQSRRAAALRAGINFKVQATATADIAFIGLILLVKAGFNVVAFMHDGYLIETAKGLIEAIDEANAAVVKMILEMDVPHYALQHFGVDITVPLKVDVKCLKTWS